MNILEIYKKYKNTPQQEEHQLRAAAAADFICEHITLSPALSQRERGNVVAACLLHDIGNIVKFDLDRTKDIFPELVAKPEDRIYWQNVKQEFIGKYGPGSHNVTMKIIAELGVNERIKELADCVGFEQAEANAVSADFGKKICAYSDMRVMPNGVASLEERMADLRIRYNNHPEGVDKRDKFESSLRKIQAQIFEYCNIEPQDISEQAIVGKKEILKNFEI